MFDKERELVEKANSLSKEEALQTMLTNPEILDPMIYLLFAIDAEIDEVLPHNKYCLLIKKKAIETNNKKLLKMVQDVERTFR